MRHSFLLLVSAVALSAYQNPDPADVIVRHIGYDLEIAHGASRWVIGIKNLPVRPIDCEHGQTCVKAAIPGCAGTCIWGSGIVSVDRRRKLAYFYVSTGTGQNKAQILFSYNLGTRSIKRLANFYGGGFYNVALSPGRRYLAVINGPHISAMCPSKAWLSVLDQWTGRLAHIAEGMAMEEHLTINALNWTTPLSFEFQGEMTMNPKCSEEDLTRKPIPVKRTVEIRQLVFK